MRRVAVEASTKKHNPIKSWAPIAIIALIACTTAVAAPWLWQFSASGLSTSPGDWGVFGDYFGGVLSTLISALGFIGIIATIKTQSDTISTQLSGIAQEKEIRDDEVYSKQSLECLNEALEKLKSPIDGKLYRSRLAWLESARLIIIAQNLAERVKSDSMQHTYKAAEKVIRSRFSTLLNPDKSPETMQPSYFYHMEWDSWITDQRQEPIHETSAYVIYKFASWQSDRLDELDAVGKIDFHHVSERYFGARQFLEHGKVEK
ncbi:hypothetical protein [Pseudomonas sp. BLCC-B112]|uniref:hypothetical protein n=1 Tax=Pseudomonas sp. BLCC-B112 TaxID=3025319 RepID=UPI00234E1862|nr:hypothetical protein [Pseudomonas sp. BLCC-B112]MDC7813723.1 hypothetical protein [Pseudomonas sp. BLCC-B112]